MPGRDRTLTRPDQAATRVLRVRRLGPGLVLVLLLLAPAGAPADAVTRHQCRVQWSDLVSLHGENGNPEAPVPELVARWEAAYDGALAHTENATAHDCGAVIDDDALAWGQLEGFMYDLHPYDPLGRLAIAEGDRRHALHFNHVKHLSKRLERQFRISRREAPRAAADLDPVMSTVPSVDVTDRDAVRAVLGELRGLSRGSQHEKELDRALRVIGDAELSEE
jgi:hypothetical protein